MHSHNLSKISVKLIFPLINDIDFTKFESKFLLFPHCAIVSAFQKYFSQVEANIYFGNQQQKNFDVASLASLCPPSIQIRLLFKQTLETFFWMETLKSKPYVALKWGHMTNIFLDEKYSTLNLNTFVNWPKIKIWKIQKIHEN